MRSMRHSRVGARWFRSSVLVVMGVFGACSSQPPSDPASSASSQKDATAGQDARNDTGTSTSDDASHDAPVVSDTTLDPLDATADATTDGSMTDATVDGPIFVFDGGVTSDVVTADSACAAQTYSASAAPLDIYVVLDRSGSMHEPGSTATQALGDCNVGQSFNSKWCKSINALSDFFNSPKMVGNRAALNFFSTSVTTACDGNAYSSALVPVGVGFLSLPDPAFDTGLNAATPGGGTPTYAAVKGIVKFTSNAQVITPGRIRVAILMTDGEPTSCTLSESVSRDELQAHFTATGVRTYAVGMDGAGFDWLEVVATGGNGGLHTSKIGNLTNTCGNGKASCYHWNVGNGDGSVLLEAFSQITRLAAGCSFKMPTTDGGIVDPNKIKLEYLPQGKTPATNLNRVTNLAACTTDGGTGGFYFDDNTNPKLIQLCPTSCGTLQADIEGKVNVLVGCLGS